LLDDSVTPIFPLYEARVAPDIYFFGFDLTAPVARGDDTVDNKPGWFFRIEEVPGDARFGFDISRDPTDDINVWNDLSWPDVTSGPAGGYLRVNADTQLLVLVEPTGEEVQEKVEQYGDDRHLTWHADMSAADLAYILFQAPVLVGVHAAEMLPAS
jgi:hypothetical protein